MSKLLFTGVLAVTAALAAHSVVRAGEHRVQRVSITEDQYGYWASGNLADVYNSQGTVEAISCSTRQLGPSYTDAICFARDEKGKTFSCATIEENVVRAIGTLDSNSTLTFGISKGYGKCTHIGVMKSSYSAPRHHPTPESDSSAIDTTGEVLQ